MTRSTGTASALPTLSVIVAAWNIEDYILVCLDSVLDNQRQDLEILIIDDGSTDATGELADRYDHDPRTRILHQTNTGLGGARNAGLDQARGRYVLFVDGDDWLAPGALDACLSAIESKPDTDLFVFDYIDVGATQQTRQHCPPDFWGCRNAAWNKIYSRSLIDSQRFDTDIFYEDMARVRPWVARADRVERIDQALYHYRNSRAGSIMNSPDTQRYFDLLTAASRCIARIQAESTTAGYAPAARLGGDWQQRLYTADVFVPALVAWPRRLSSARQRRDFAADFLSRLPSHMLDKRRLARDFSYKIAVAAACYERGGYRSGDWLLHRLGRIKRRVMRERAV